MNNDIVWIKRRSRKGRDIARVLAEARRLRRNWRLAGSNPIYDFNMGCYGNPNAKIMFIAENASMRGLKRIIQDKNIPKQDRWSTSWRGHSDDKILRKALVKQGLIPRTEGGQKTPWIWKCWISNFVKCAASSEAWKKKKYSKKQRILEESGELLAKEISIIQPHAIVFIGRNAESYFKKTCVAERVKKFNSAVCIDLNCRHEPENHLKVYIYKVRHYAARESHSILARHYDEQIARAVNALK